MEFASSVALSAWESFLVDLGSVTLEAGDHIAYVVNLLFKLRSDELTVDFLFLSLDDHLAAFALSLDASIATGFFGIFLNL